MNWCPYTVDQGDTLTSLAAQRGMSREAIWSHGDNAALKRLRPNPDILAPGDVIYLPARERKFLAVSIGKGNTFVAKIPMMPIQVRLPDYAGASYTAFTNTMPLLPGSVGGDGTVTLSVPAARTSLIEMTFKSPDGAARIQVGHLDPISTLTGQRQRLQSLAIPLPEPSDDPDCHALRRGIAIYQALRGLPPTGECDAATLKLLVADHGL